MFQIDSIRANFNRSSFENLNQDIVDTQNHSRYSPLHDHRKHSDYSSTRTFAVEGRNNIRDPVKSEETLEPSEPFEKQHEHILVHQFMRKCRRMLKSCSIMEV